MATILCACPHKLRTWINYQKKNNWERFSLYQTMCRIVKSKKKGNSNNNLVKTRGMHEAITFLVTNQIFVSTRAPCRTKEKKKRKRKKQEKVKAKTPKSQSSHQNLAFKKSYWSMIMHIIFDLIGIDLPSQIMAC